MEKAYKFYVIEDLNKSPFNIKRFDAQQFNAALDLFLGFPSQGGQLPALGVENGGYSIDILHAVNGESILVTDYRMREVLSPQINAIYGDIEAIVNELVNNGTVRLEYNKSKASGAERFKSIDKVIEGAVKRAEAASGNMCNKEVSIEKE